MCVFRNLQKFTIPVIVFYTPNSKKIFKVVYLLRFLISQISRNKTCMFPSVNTKYFHFDASILSFEATFFTIF